MNHETLQNLDPVRVLRLLALERKRVQELTQKLQEGGQKASKEKIRPLIAALKERLLSQEESASALRAQLEQAQTRIAELESSPRETPDSRQLPLLRETLSKTSAELSLTTERLAEVERAREAALEAARTVEEERDQLEVQLQEFLRTNSILEGRLRDFEPIKEALFKAQEKQGRLHGEISEINEKLSQARRYGEEMQQALAEKNRELQNVSNDRASEAELRYLSTLFRLQTLERHALLLRSLFDTLVHESHTLHEHSLKARRAIRDRDNHLQEAQRHLAKRMKQATLLQAAVEQEKLRADHLEATLKEAHFQNTELTLKIELAEEKARTAEAEASSARQEKEHAERQMRDAQDRLESHNSRVRELEKRSEELTLLQQQHQELQTLFNTIRTSLGGFQPPSPPGEADLFEQRDIPKPKQDLFDT